MNKLVSTTVFEGSHTQNMQGRLCFLKAYDNGNVYLGYEANSVGECLVDWYKLPPTQDDIDNKIAPEFRQEVKGEFTDLRSVEFDGDETQKKRSNENVPYIHPGERNA